MVTRARLWAASAAVCLGVLVTAAVAHGVEAGPVASVVPMTITASSLDVGSLVYQGRVPVTTADGTVQALRFDLQDATFHDLALTTACVPISLGGLIGRTTTTGASTTSSLTLYATEVQVTIGQDRFRFSTSDPQYPPPTAAGTSLVSDGSIGEPVIVSVLATSASLRLGSSATTTSFCGPSPRAALTGGVPWGPTPTPSVTATPGASTDDAATPAPVSPPSKSPAGSPAGEPSATATDEASPDADVSSPPEPTPLEPTPPEPTPAGSTPSPG